MSTDRRRSPDPRPAASNNSTDAGSTSPILLLAQEIEAPDRAVIATAADGSILYWGKGAESLYGWTADEVLGRSIVDVTPAAISKQDAAAIMQALQAGDPWCGEFLLRRKDGTPFSALVTDVPVHDRDGELLGIVGISRPARYVRPL